MKPTPRETEAAELFRSGLAYLEIATRMQVTVGTVACLINRYRCRCGQDALPKRLTGRKRLV